MSAVLTPVRQPGRPADWRRTATLLRLFRAEQHDPDAFYGFLAADTVADLSGYADLRGAVAVDIGGGPGYTAEALRAAGASCVVVEYAHEELVLHDRSPEVAVQGDGQALPLASGGVDVVHSSNVLEHVPEPDRMLGEMVRILRPGTGVGYLTFTNWFSPWGGHETSPWHYLGGERAVARYRRRYGSEPKNRYGHSLYRLDIAPVRRWFAGRDDVEVLWSGPRYWPSSLRFVADVPAVREVLTWNLVVVFRRRP